MASVEPRHTQAAEALLGPNGEMPLNSIADIAQMLADEYEAGRQKGLDEAEAAIRAMQPGPAREETYFERHAANSKVILDCTRALHDARHGR